MTGISKNLRLSLLWGLVISLVVVFFLKAGLPTAYAESTERSYIAYQKLLNCLDLAEADAVEGRKLIQEMRRYRIGLLDRKRTAESSDDDHEAAMLGMEVANMDELILDAEQSLIIETSSSRQPPPGLPGGLERGLVLHYTFDDESGHLVKDWSPHGNQGRVEGVSWTAHGRRGGAYRFDGIADHIQTGPVVTEEMQRFTLSLSIYRESADRGAEIGAQYLLSSGLGSSSDFWLYLTPNGGVGAGLRHKIHTHRVLRLAAEPTKHRVTKGSWIHLVLTYDGSHARTFVNGREDKSVLLPGGKGISEAPLQIGRRGKDRRQQGFQGKLDDLIIWNRPLEEVEVLGLWASMNHADN